MSAYTRKYKSLQLVVFLLVMGAVGLAVSPRLSCIQAYTLHCPQLPVSANPTVELATRYFEYSPLTLQQALQSGETVVLYFWAPWCSTCSSLDTELQENKSSIPTDLIVLRVNYDQETVLKSQFEVITQHTFIQLDTLGKPVSSWIGGDIENFDRYLK